MFDTYFLLCNIVKATPIHSFSWSANNSSAVWALLAEIKKNENYRVLYRKKDVAKVSLSIPLA
jgi:hypothetical protein